MIKHIEEASIQPLQAPSSNNTSKAVRAAEEAGAKLESTAKTETPVTEMVKTVTEMVDKSPNLITALEYIGPMYGIKPTQLIVDSDANGIRVEDDTIIVPDAPAKNQTKPIIQAIGSVLDYISQRVDEKLNDYQMDNINNGRLETKMANADPSKGKCIGIYNDDDGAEIMAYDTGRVDAPPTEAARRKIEELRASNAIPTFDPSIQDKKPGDEYFNDEDIAAGIDMKGSSNISSEACDIKENNIPEKIQESAYHVNLISKYNNTTHLGYDVLTKHGFDFVKPVDSVVLEADETPKTKIASSDIKYLKFDNTGIKDAVKYFNKAREGQDNVKTGGMDIKTFISDPNYEKAIDALNKQFNCRLNIRYGANDKAPSNVSTFVLNKEYKKNLTISKSKGFQLSGQPIDIIVNGHYFEQAAPNNELFGQAMVSTILHEIFHNIVSVLRSEAVNANMSLMMTMDIAASAKTAKDKRVIITNYVESLASADNNGKLFNKAVKKKMIKNLTSLAVVGDNEKVAGEMRKTAVGTANPDEYINNLMKLYKNSSERLEKRQSSFKRRNIFGMVSSAMVLLAGVLLPAGAIASIGAISVGSLGFLLNLGKYNITKASIERIHEEYANSNKFEEYYCNLFAGMYGLPIVFFIGDRKYRFTANDFKSEDLDKLAKLEKEYHQMAMSSYPSNLERNRAGVKIAKDLLANGNLDDSMKKYCQWVVDNFSNLENTNIDTIYNNTTYDPKEAENLDKHLDDLINDNNIVLTESYTEWMNDGEII